MVYPVWLLQYKDCISDTIQRQYLDYLWNRNEGIYYVSNVPPSKIKFLESKEFSMWFYCLENLSGFSMFSEFMNNQITEHLYHEINRLVYETVELPPAPPIFGHYAENWSNRGEQKSYSTISLSASSKHIDTHINARKNDMILRIARLLAKCE